MNSSHASNAFNCQDIVLNKLLKGLDTFIKTKDQWNVFEIDYKYPETALCFAFLDDESIQHLFFQFVCLFFFLKCVIKDNF